MIGEENGHAMTDKDQRGAHTTTPAGDSRQQRLKLALRENLKRRKSQARGKSAEAPSTETELSLHEEPGKRGV